MKKVILTIDAKLLEEPALAALFKELSKRHKIDVDTAPAEAAVKNLGNSITTAFAKFGLAKQGIDSALGIVQKIAKAFIAPAAEMEQFRLRLNALYGSVEDASKAFEKFRVIAAKTPATLGEVVQAGANLKAFGMDAENTLASVQDLAAFMGIDVVEASQAVGRAFAGGAGAAIVLRERGILELVRSFAKVDDLTKLSLPEFREALIGAMQDPAIGIAGASETMSNSFTGAMSNMDDSLYTLQAKIGGAFTPVLTSATNALSNFISNLAGVGSHFQVVSKDATEQKIQFETLIGVYEDLHQKTNKTTEESQLYQATINDLMRLYPNYFNHIDLEKGKWDDIQKAISGAKDALNDWLNMKVQEAVIKDRQEELQKVQRQWMDARKQEKRFYAELVDSVKNDETNLANTFKQQNLRSQMDEQKTFQTQYKSQIETIKKDIEADIKLMKELFDYTPPISEKPMHSGLGAGSSSGSGGTATTSAKDQVAAALAELRRLFADERELIQIEFERRSALIATAYKSGSEEAVAAIKKLDEWRTTQLDNIAQKELDVEAKKQKELEAIRALEKRQLLADYDAEIQRLSNLKTIGALSYNGLTSSLKAYTERIKETFGAQSDEYLHALEAMRLAQLRISETLAEQWRKDNSAFLDIFDTTSNAMIAGFDTAWGTILDKNMTGSQRLNLIWDGMKNSFIQSIGAMTTNYLKNKMTELAVTLTAEKSKQGAILQTLGIQKSSFIASIAMGIKSAFASLFESIAHVWKWWAKLIPPPFSVTAAIATGAGMIAAFKGIKKSLGFAAGGLISGPGSATSDSIPIFASNGEYVVNARAVAQPGILPLLQHINAVTSPNMPFSSPAHFASGGLVSHAAIAPADLKSLINEVKEMRIQLHSAIYDAQPTVINNAPNNIDIYKAAENGRKLYKGY